MGAIHFSIDQNLLSALSQVLPLDVFVETGTYRGDTTAQVAERRLFRNIYTIEFSPTIYEQTLARLRSYSTIEMMYGDSPNMLRQLQNIVCGRSVVYWLDAHWCGEATAGYGNECPLFQELTAIGELNDRSVVLIDDARFFIAPPPAPHDAGQWPTIDDVVLQLRRLSEHHKLWLINDVLIFAPSRIAQAIAGFSRANNIDLMKLYRTASSAHEALAKAKHEIELRGKVIQHFQQTVNLDPLLDPTASAGFNAGLLKMDRSVQIFAHHAQRLGIQRVLDIGANAGQFAQKLRKLGYRNTIYSVEPLSSAYKQLVANARQDLTWIPLARQAAGTENKTAELNVAENSWSSSILEVHPNHEKTDSSTRVVGKEKIYVRPAGELMQPELMAQIDAVKIDVQGFESQVLQGLKDELSHVRLLQVEMSVVECYYGETDMFTLDQWITQEQGFERVSLEPAYYDDLSGVAQQYDGIYYRPGPPKAAPAVDIRKNVSRGQLDASRVRMDAGRSRIEMNDARMVAGHRRNDTDQSGIDADQRQQGTTSARKDVSYSQKDFAIVTSVGGTMQRQAVGGQEVGARWFETCCRSWLQVSHRIYSVSEVEPPLPQIEWLRTQTRPSVSEIIQSVNEKVSQPLIIINADIALTDRVPLLLPALDNSTVYYGSRVDSTASIEADGSMTLAGIRPYTWGFDWFILPKPFVQFLNEHRKMPSQFHIGQPWWDYLLPLLALCYGYPLKRLTVPYTLAAHLKHETRYSPQSWIATGLLFIDWLKSVRDDPTCVGHSLVEDLLAFSFSGSDFDRLQSIAVTICNDLP